MWLIARMIHPIIVRMRLVLASASPRRAELLRAAGFEFETLVVDVDESVRPGERAEDYVRRLAMEKSARAMATIVGSGISPTGGNPPKGGSHVPIVLGADTAVVIDGDILGKPRDDEDAASMLRRLSGRPHQVMTGVSLRGPEWEANRVETTTVEFSPLSEADIAWYVGSGEGRDKAGAYAIQGLASRFIPRVEGSYSNVVGLPTAAVHELLAGIASRP
jgi:septum formation protein